MAQKIRIIGVPMDLGASRRGVDMGPSALRVAGLQARIKQLGCQVEDIGNIAVKQPEEMSYGEKRAKYLAEIADACKDLGVMVEKSLEENLVPVVLGGDHSIAIGTWGGVARGCKGKPFGLVWFDAHLDAHTVATSPSLNPHGMSAAVLLGHGEADELVHAEPPGQPGREEREGAEGDDRDDDHQWHEPARDLIGQPLDRRARALRIRDHLHDLRQ